MASAVEQFGNITAIVKMTYCLCWEVTGMKRKIFEEVSEKLLENNRYNRPYIKWLKSNNIQSIFPHPLIFLIINIFSIDLFV